MKSRSPGKNSPCFLQDKLKIIIRMRPILNEQDADEFIELEDDNTLQIKRPGNHTFMKFNNILPPCSTQKDVFNLVQDSIKQFLGGTNITIFAYGQTGAGKTYSMIGNYSPKDSQENLFNFLSSKQRGILSRSLQMIMTFIRKKKGHRVFVSFFQIYNEKIFDLYNNTMVPLDIRESKNGEISIPDLLNIQVSEMQEAIQYLMVGLKNRATGSTHGNAQSSRSHSIFQINLEREDENGETVYSSLRIVDLAGSEKFKIPSDLSPAEKEIRIQQLTNINGSLSCLGHCISALIQKSRTHIPFRNSKLTRILSDSLLGHGKMRFIICISPSLSASAETFSTLQFANRAKKAIFQRAEMRTPNLNKKKSSENEQITSMRRELEKQRQLRMQLQKQLASISSQRPEGIIKQNMYLRKQNQKLKQQLKQMMVKNPRNSKSPQASSRFNFNHHDENYEKMDLKSEMLKLPIFKNQKSFQLLENNGNSLIQIKNSKVQALLNNNNNNSNQLKQSSVNRKKAQFEKKVRRFIESDSPPEQSRVSVSKMSKPTRQQIASKQNREFTPIFPSSKNCQNPKKKVDHVSSRSQNMDTYGYEHSISHEQIVPQIQQQSQQQNQWMQNEDTQQLIEQACEKMNLPDFKDLKSEMDRAKQQLMAFRQKDDEISRRKGGVTLPLRQF